MEWTEEQYKRFEKFILDDNMDFYEEYTIHLTDEEQEPYVAPAVCGAAQEQGSGPGEPGR